MPSIFERLGLRPATGENPTTPEPPKTYTLEVQATLAPTPTREGVQAISWSIPIDGLRNSGATTTLKVLSRHAGKLHTANNYTIRIQRDSEDTLRLTPKIDASQGYHSIYIHEPNQPTQSVKGQCVDLFPSRIVRIAGNQAPDIDLQLQQQETETGEIVPYLVISCNS